MNEHYDVVVVGGRVAGATLATHVARSGMGVCVLERADFPSDTLSTHVFQYLEGFERLGVMERLLATGAPPLTEFRLRVDGVDMAQEHPDLAMLNIRRPVLDPILLDNAAAAGADVALRTRVVGLLHDERRVTGVRIEDAEGRRSEIRARVVVGADGRNSTVARLVGARRYNVTENERAGGVAYYEGVEAHGVFHLSILGPTYFIGSSCDNGLFMACAYYDKADHRRFREPNGFEEALATCPSFASMLRGATMTGPPLFASRWQGFFREPAGPGWALVGDAGHFKDPAPGQGIADAVRQAERLAEYVCYGIDTHTLGDQLAGWWRWRDHDAAEMYWWAREYGRAGPQSPVVVEMFRRLAAKPRTLRAAHAVAFHEARPFRVFSPVRASAAAARLLARGGTPRGKVLSDLVTLGTRDFQRRWRTHRPVYERGPGRDAQEEPEQMLHPGVET
ncbi:MAG TPA: FAD-dependent monooxygenase [Actinomycetota bacterium]|jgi:flavin-dependent dehydrogenase